MLVARKYKTLGFSVPPTMAQRIEDVARKKQLTKSELFRDMFRAWEEKEEMDREFSRMVTQTIAEAEEGKKRNPKSKAEILAGLRHMAKEISERAEVLGLEMSEDGEIVEKRA